ncbi:MAG: hypothetical protein K2O03_05220 [Lachnospiraceae bacterium]|nr:hypothetical protein [Lachnospiraceae bacterium]
MANFTYKPPTISGMEGYYCILLPDKSEVPILNRLANPNYIHNGRRVFLTDRQRKKLCEFVHGTGQQ